MTATFTITTRSGKSVESPFTDRGAYDRLRHLVAAGLPGDFPASLVSRPFERCSPEQVKWIHVVAVEGGAIMEARARGETPANVRQVENSPDLMPVLQLLLRAREVLKYPKIRLALESETITISLARPKPGSRVAAWIVTDIPDARGKVRGAILDSGVLSSARNGAFPTELMSALRRLAEDPAGAARLHGRVTGRCCFCGLLLEDGRSVGAGYGPICAEKWGLPWGDETRVSTVVDEPIGRPEVAP